MADVGRRIYCEGYYGTVKYIGRVPPSDGEWIGVEWDNPERGKHDGIHEGVKYFTCSTTGSGSFVRRKKLDFGLSFSEIVQERYQHKIIESMTIGEGKGSYGKAVEFVGMDELFGKVSHYDLLVDVDLSQTLVSNPGTEGDITRLNLINVTYLNLTHTLLSSWDEVAIIVSQLPKLNHLIVSENKLRLPLDPLSLTCSFTLITDLVINKMNIDCLQLSCILTMMSNLRQLNVCKNNISALSLPADSCIFPVSLELINLEENKISDWSEVLTLQHLPQLQVLLLSGNQLSNINISPGSFQSLMTLSLSSNNIQSWLSVNELYHLTKLEHLIIIDNPLMKDETAFNRRQLLIAKLPQINLLNRSSIFDKERVQSERYYIKRYFTQWTLAKKEDKLLEFFQSHPQYERLIEKHGVPEVEMEQITSNSALKNRLLAVTIKCNDGSLVSKKLPDSMTILKLKGMIQRLFKISSTEQKLSYSNREGDHIIELNDDLKPLSFYSIESGDTIDVCQL